MYVHAVGAKHNVCVCTFLSVCDSMSLYTCMQLEQSTIGVRVPVMVCVCVGLHFCLSLCDSMSVYVWSTYGLFQHTQGMIGNICDLMFGLVAGYSDSYPAHAGNGRHSLV